MTIKITTRGPKSQALGSSGYSMEHDSQVGTRRQLWLPLALLLCLLVAPPPSFAATQAQLNELASAINDDKVSLANARRQLSRIEDSLADADNQIQTLRSTIRQERNSNRREYHEAQREVKRQSFEIDRIERELALIDSNIEIIKRDRERDQQNFEALNVLKQRLQDREYKTRQKEYEAEIEKLIASKVPLRRELRDGRELLSQLQAQSENEKQSLSDDTLDQDPRILSLIRGKKNNQVTANLLNSRIDTLSNRIASKNLQFNRMMADFRSRQNDALNLDNLSTNSNPRPKPQSTSAGSYQTYVVAVSGEQDPDIEKTLQLKSLVETYNGKYIEARWNSFDGQGFSTGFSEFLKQIPASAKLILIGHGLGGGAAIDAATIIAHQRQRDIDLLVALDPIGAKNLRANIVFDSKQSCPAPDTLNPETNTEYLDCIKQAAKRQITNNVHYFYNRWQKDAVGPVDGVRRILTIDSIGQQRYAPTASGRFDIASATESNQRRLFFNGDPNAHKLLLEQAATNIPNLIVNYLR